MRTEHPDLSEAHSALDRWHQQHAAMNAFEWLAEPAASRGVEALPPIAARAFGRDTASNEPVPAALRKATLLASRPPLKRSTLWHLDRHFTARGYGADTVRWAHRFIGDPLRLDGEQPDSDAVLDLMTLVESSPLFEFQTPGAQYDPERDTPMNAALVDAMQTLDRDTVDHRLSQSNRGFEGTVLANPYRRACELRASIMVHGTRRAAGLAPAGDQLQLQRELRLAQSTCWLMRLYITELMSVGLARSARTAEDDLDQITQHVGHLNRLMRRAMAVCI
jgi:hypothetical protein